MKIYLSKRLKSFSYAIDGLVFLFRNEPNAKLHAFFAICVVIAGFVFDISSMEWIGIILSIGLVIGFEIINTSIEKLADHISPEWNDQIKIVKDLGAAAVLIAAITSIIIGILVFLN